MKKILLSLPFDSSFLPPIKKTLKNLNYQVYYHDYRHGDFLLRILIKILGSKMAYRYRDFKILRLIRENNIDIFWVVKGESISKELLKKIKKNNVTTINWFPDPMNWWKFMRDNASYYDYFFHFDPLVVRKLKNLGFKNIYYLPFAAEIFSKKNSRKIYDVSFVGTYSKYRERYLTNLNCSLNIWGDPRWSNSSLKKFTKGGRVSQDEMKKIIRLSKINLNLIYDAVREGTNLRTFEVLGQGSFLLTEYVKDLDNLFASIVSFKSKEELVKKINYYLLNEKKREKIARNGLKEVIKSHTYEIRLKQMIKIIEKS